jgi:hypothetical protein
MMLAIAIMVAAVMIVIPVVPVLESSVIAFPIAVVIPSALVAGTNPTCTCIWRTGPVSRMPPVVSAYGIPIAVNPHKFRPRTWWKNTNNAWRWWWTNCDTDRYLAASDMRTAE